MYLAYFLIYLSKAFDTIDYKRCIFSSCCNAVKNATCDDHSHLNKIILFYSEIISALTKASKAALSYHQNTPQYSQVPGWNKKTKSLHSAACYAFLTWVYNCRPRHGVYFEKMKVTRKKFKLSLRHYRKLKDQPKSDALATALQSTSSRTAFWKKVRVVYRKDNNSIPLFVGRLMLQIYGNATIVDF